MRLGPLIAKLYPYPKDCVDENQDKCLKCMTYLNNRVFMLFTTIFFDKV